MRYPAVHVRLIVRLILLAAIGLHATFAYSTRTPQPVVFQAPLSETFSPINVRLPDGPGNESIIRLSGRNLSVEGTDKGYARIGILTNKKTISQWHLDEIPLGNEKIRPQIITSSFKVRGTDTGQIEVPVDGGHSLTIAYVAGEGGGWWVHVRKNREVTWAALDATISSASKSSTHAFDLMLARQTVLGTGTIDKKTTLTHGTLTKQGAAANSQPLITYVSSETFPSRRLPLSFQIVALGGGTLRVGVAFAELTFGVPGVLSISERQSVILLGDQSATLMGYGHINITAPPGLMKFTMTARSIRVNRDEKLPREIENWSWYKQLIVWSVFGLVAGSLVTDLRAHLGKSVKSQESKAL
jgi:hypothetical protein